MPLYELLEDYKALFSKPNATAMDMLIQQEAVMRALLELYAHLQSDKISNHNQVVDILLEQFGLTSKDER